MRGQTLYWNACLGGGGGKCSKRLRIVFNTDALLLLVHKFFSVRCQQGVWIFNIKNKLNSDSMHLSRMAYNTVKVLHSYRLPWINTMVMMSMQILDSTAKFMNISITFLLQKQFSVMSTLEFILCINFQSQNTKLSAVFKSLYSHF